MYMHVCIQLTRACAPHVQVVPEDAPPLPDKNPRDLRLQYKAYLSSCYRKAQVQAYAQKHTHAHTHHMLMLHHS